MRRDFPWPSLPARAFAALPLARTIRPRMFRHVPNALTGVRLLLAAVFFVVRILFIVATRWS